MAFYRHRCDIVALTGDSQQDMPNLCRQLDEWSRESWELVQIMPLTMDQPSLRNGVLTPNKQPGLAVFLRQQIMSPFEQPEAA